MATNVCNTNVCNTIYVYIYDKMYKNYINNFFNYSVFFTPQNRMTTFDPFRNP